MPNPRSSKHLMSLGLMGLVVGGCVAVAQGGEDSAKQALKEIGIRVVSSGLMLDEEAEFNKSFSGISRLKRKLTAALRKLKASETQEQRVKDEISRLMRINVDLNSQLANVPNGDVTLNNRLVGALNANGGKIQLLVQAQEKRQKQLDKARKAANSARETYIGRVLELRPLAEKISKRYGEIGKDEDIRAAIAQLKPDDEDKPLEFKPSRIFRSNVKRLEILEETIVSEKIPLRRKGNSFFASVVLGGEHPLEMVVDSGASLLTLPHRLAVECGIQTSKSDRPITLVIADGSRISGRLVKVDTVRVGTFTVSDVECAVLGPEATEAPALLGMSFLGEFKFELNAQASELSLIRVDSEPQGRGRKSSSSK